MSLFRNFAFCLPLTILTIISSPVALAQEDCVVSGSTLSQARSNFGNQCTVELVDCDLFNGQWYCASFNLNSSTPPALTVGNTSPVATPIAVPQPATPSIRPSCARADSDSDGDGFGWENNQTCVVTNSSAPEISNTAPAVSQVDPAPAPVAAPQPSTPGVRPSCVRADSDSDGDGFGWENNQSCVVTNSATPAPATPAPSTPVTVVTPQSAPGSGQTGTVTAADITDLILVTGQSNALGAGTDYNPSLDAPNNRVFAFTDNGWQVANLNQVWDLNWHPRNHPETDPSNNFSLHFGKTVAARDSSRVVGFILATSPGSKIVTWNLGSSFYNSVQSKVIDALSRLPHKNSIDGILWHQGESDGQDIQSYTDALYSLIFNFRNEQWVQNQAPFICGETKIAPVNRRLNGLNGDSDPNTACVRGIDLSTHSDGVHFDARALRTIGARYGDAYLNITR